MSYPLIDCENFVGEVHFFSYIGEFKKKRCSRAFCPTWAKDTLVPMYSCASCPQEEGVDESNKRVICLQCLQHISTLNSLSFPEKIAGALEKLNQNILAKF